MEKSIKQKMPFGFYVCSLAFTFERFAFYSAKWLMTIFVATAIMEGGLGLGKPEAAKMAANLVAFTYFTPLIGSWISDRFVGAKYLVPVGMALMGAGYLMAWHAQDANDVNIMIILVSIGTGLFKPQTNGITGRLFKDKEQLDGAFSTQYSFVNLGSFIGTTVIGLLAKSYGYRICFLICAIMMFVDAVWFVFGWKYLGEAGKRPFKIDETQVEKVEQEEKKPLTSIEKKRVAAIILISAFSVVFWLFWYMAYLPIYFHWHGDNPAANWFILGFEVPSSWFDSLNALCCIAMGPLLGMLWTKKAKSAKGDFDMFQKTALGLLLLGLSYAIFALIDVLRGGNQASLIWIILFGIVLSLGEMVFSPLGNSFISKFSPPRLLTAMLSVWVISIFFAGKAHGWIYEFSLQFPFAITYFVIAGIAAGSGVILWLLSGKLNKLVIEEKQ